MSDYGDLEFNTQSRGTKLRDQQQVAVRSCVIVPIMNTAQAKHEAATALHQRSPQARFEEAMGLARAINLDIVASQLINVNTPRPATLLGPGKIEELAALVEELDITLTIVDHALTPVQQRNLEKALQCKVIDRTGLILEIFGERAQTREGRLQVELAHLEYQKGRLVRSWTHLERQRGGGGFLGGPGETQIEADRRLLQEKILRLKKEIEQVKRTRNLHRQQRRKVPWPIVALVGYTNAGKSTLFNSLTKADVMAKDMLFATLDPTLRQLAMPHGGMVILSDTVGFISDLPTHLIAAFRATLEEVIEADLIIHVRDISDPDTNAQAQDVETILASLDIDIRASEHVLEVWNKIDLLDEQAKQNALQLAATSDIIHKPVLISALTNEGIEPLIATIEQMIFGDMQQATVTLATDQMHLQDWLYKNARILKRHDQDDGSVRFDVQWTDAAKQGFDQILAQN